jgi:hypothetical protein
VGPPLGRSIAIGIRAAAREPWLVPVSAVLGLLRTATLIPAAAVATVLPLEGAHRAAQLRPFSLTAPLEGALAVVGSHRYALLVGALWLAGAVLSGALRVLFLSGALPTLGARIAGEPHPRRFAAGVAFGFARQLATAALAALAEGAAAGYFLVAFIAVPQVAGSTLATDHPVAVAVAGALFLTMGVGGVLVARVLGDAAAARTAILGERPARAFAGAVRRLGGRPGGFLLGGMAALVAGMAATAFLQPFGAVLASLGDRLDPQLVAGPRLMLGLLAVLASAAVDLGWLSTVGVLACAEAGPPTAGAGPSA